MTDAMITAAVIASTDCLWSRLS